MVSAQGEAATKFYVVTEGGFDITVATADVIDRETDTCKARLPISPLYLPYISPISPLHLPCISPISCAPPNRPQASSASWSSRPQP